MSDYMTIYLAGAMTGKTLEEMNKWRKDVTRAIELSPDFRRMVRVVNPVLYYSTAELLIQCFTIRPQTTRRSTMTIKNILDGSGEKLKMQTLLFRLAIQK